MRDWLVSFFSLRNPTIVVLSCGACVSILVVVSTAAEFQVMDRLTVSGPAVVLGSTTVSGALGVGASGLEGGGRWSSGRPLDFPPKAGSNLVTKNRTEKP